jgi:hypothetical protein
MKTTTAALTISLLALTGCQDGQTLSPEQWQQIGGFLTNVGAAANERTPDGFLVNPSLGSAINAGAQATQREQMERQPEQPEATQESCVRTATGVVCDEVAP